MPSLLLALQDPLSDCSLLGICGVVDRAGPPPGLMFLAVGLVLAGGYGLWRELRPNRNRTPS